MNTIIGYLRQAGTAVRFLFLTADDAGTQAPRWFHARPSAVKWDPASSSASNLGPN
ncbi:MAG: kdpC, partial [Arthrobacter sp.]|nr:kdpC [Arthrobacter sp.]